jgi:hypothetical protein
MSAITCGCHADGSLPLPAHPRRLAPCCSCPVLRAPCRGCGEARTQRKAHRALGRPRDSTRLPRALQCCGKQAGSGAAGSAAGQGHLDLCRFTLASRRAPSRVPNPTFKKHCFRFVSALANSTARGLFYSLPLPGAGHVEGILCFVDLNMGEGRASGGLGLQSFFIYRPERGGLLGSCFGQLWGLAVVGRVAVPPFSQPFCEPRPHNLNPFLPHPHRLPHRPGLR